MITRTISKGKVSVPCHSCGSVTSVQVKQKKGNGTYDAIRLKGKLPKPEHIQIIKVMGKKTPTAEQIRYKVNKQRKHPIIQSHFQRFHSELLFWKIILKTDDKIQPPTYYLNQAKGQCMIDGGKFS